MRASRLLQCLTVLSLLLLPGTASAHRSGCHTLHTCPSDSESYVCGDLGYACDGATSINEINPSSVNVPLLVEKVFGQIFGRDITPAESTYWKNRYRSDKDTLSKLRTAMRYHNSIGSFGPKTTAVGVTTKHELASRINMLFRSVYDGRNPTAAENRYWLSRIKDKPFAAQMIGAMSWHRDNGIKAAVQ